MKVSVVVPWRDAGEPNRTANWAVVKAMWEEFNIADVIPADAGGEPFSRGQSINVGVEQSGADVIIIADADVVVPLAQVARAVEEAQRAPGIVQPFTKYIPLSPSDTLGVHIDGRLKGASGLVLPAHLVNKPEASWTCLSGCLAMSRESFEKVGGFDERFKGWGYEDLAFDLTMLNEIGPRRYIFGPAWHLSHPAGKDVQPRRNLPLWLSYLDRYYAHIPRILHRTVPSVTNTTVEDYWRRWCDLHPAWEHQTWRDPLNPRDWETGHLWDRAVAGAQLGGFIRLEVLWRHGGVYVDSDLEPVRALDPLVDTNKAWAVREDARCIPDFVLAAPPKHPAIRACLDRVLNMDPAELFHPTRGAWNSGPGVTTKVFGGRDNLEDVIILPAVSFAPYHYSVKEAEEGKDWASNPETYGIHRWAASWPGALGHKPATP